jgi:hypothetical protein
MKPRCEAGHVRAKFSATLEKGNREARPGARRNCLAVDPGAAWACQARYDSAGRHDGGLWPLPAVNPRSGSCPCRKLKLEPGSEPSAMPSDDGLRLEDSHRVQYLGSQVIEPRKHQAVDIADGYPLARPTPEHIELMPKGENFGLQRCARGTPGLGVPDQLEEIAHRRDWVYGRYSGRGDPIGGVSARHSRSCGRFRRHSGWSIASSSRCPQPRPRAEAVQCIACRTWSLSGTFPPREDFFPRCIESHRPAP